MTRLLLVASTILLWLGSVLGQDSCLEGLPDDLLERRKVIFKDCGSKFQIEEAVVTTQRLRKGRRPPFHPFYKGTPVRICLSAVATGIQEPIEDIQVILHGKIVIQVPFCDVGKSACRGPGNGNNCPVKPGERFCTCITAQNPDVPTPFIDDVPVTLRLVSVPPGTSIDSCETSADEAELKSKGKETLICMEVPAKLRSKSDFYEAVRDIRKKRPAGVTVSPAIENGFFPAN